MREGAWLAATIALFLLSVLLRQSLLFTLSLALLLAAMLARLWNRYCFTRLEYRREIVPRRAFIGEEVELTTEVVNRKVLPLAWLEVEDELPDELILVSGRPSPSHRPRRYQLVNLLSLRWYERVRRRYRLKCNQRGFFTLGPVHMRSGDIFGLAMREWDGELPDQVLVYPKVVPIGALGLPSQHPFGELRTRHRLFEDPLRTVGVRPYEYGDSLRRVHWKATARTQELQVRLYEATTTLRLVVFLNMNTFGPRWWWMGHDPTVLELAITVAASVANWGIEQDYQVGLYANGNARRSDEKVKIPPGRDPAQLTKVLEALAKVMPFATVPIEDLLRAESRSLPWGSTVVLVTALVSEELMSILEGLKVAGHQVAMLVVGESAGVGAVLAPPVGAASSAPTGAPSSPAGRSLVTTRRSEGMGGEVFPSPLVGEGRGVRVSAGIQIHRVKVSWREIRDLQLD